MKAFRFTINMADDIHLIDIDPGQLEHTIINMAINARDSMHGEGDFTHHQLQY